MVTCLLVMAIFAGCGTSKDSESQSGTTSGENASGQSSTASNESTKQQTTTTDIAQKLMDGITFDDELIQLEGDRMTTQYDEINADDLEEYTVYVSSSGATPEEVAVFKLKEGGDAQALEDAIDSRVQDQKDGFVDYVPEEMPKLENCAILHQGNYYALVVAGDSSGAQDIFDGCFA